MGESPGKMYALATVLPLLAIVAIVFRFRVRVKSRQRFGWDDYLIIPAFICTIGTAATVFEATARGRLGQHMLYDSNGEPVFDGSVEIFLKANYVSLLTQNISFGLTKLAVLAFYQRIFRGKWFVIASRTMVVVVIAWTIAFFFANLLQCIPISLNWTFTGIQGGCINEIQMYIANAWSDIWTDALVLALPIPCVWQLQMPTMRKVAVSGIFLLGALVIAAGIAKLVVFYAVAYSTNNNDTDLIYVLAPTFYWPLVESCLGIVAACLPTLRPLFYGMSPESVVRSLRSVLSLRSLRSTQSKKSGGSNHEDNDTTSQSSFAKKNGGAVYSGDRTLEGPICESNSTAFAMDKLNQHSQMPPNGILVDRNFTIHETV